MFTLLNEVNLWTFDDNINIKDADFGAFRYHDKRADSLHEEGKRSYGQKRGMMYVPSNKKHNKLKDSIKYLEEQLKDNSCIYCKWYNHCTLQIMLSNGLLIQIQIKVYTGDIQKITFDKYLVGKLSDHVSDVIITNSHLICVYNDNQITLLNFTKLKLHLFDKISKLEPKFCNIELNSLSGRRLDKKIQVNKSGNLVLIWWKSTMNEVYPWSPTIKEHDRANVHLYRLGGIKLNLACYLRTEFDPLCIMFDAHHDNIIHSVEQKVSRKGEVTIEWRTYEVSQQDKLQKIAIISIPLPTHTSCIKFSPKLDMLLLCCIDGSIILYDRLKSTTITMKAAFIPTLASWHYDGIIFVLANERGQFQHFDISLACIKCQTLTEDATPANILDLSSYFRNQSALLKMEWNEKCKSNLHTDEYIIGDSLFLLLFERGPIGILRVIEGNNFTGDKIVQKYLSMSHVEQATSLLLSMNWDVSPSACMHSLNQILNCLFKLPLTEEYESLIQNALGSFHVPIRPISQTVEEEYGDEVRDLTRRFFYYLLRYRMFEKAFRLAIDLNDHDLFMDIHFYALIVNDTQMAEAAKDKAEQIISRSSSCDSTHSTCSRDSCSLCSDSSSDRSEEPYSEESEYYSKEQNNSKNSNQKHNPKRSPNCQIPPLPVLPSHFDDKNLLSTSFNDITFPEKSDYSLMSTSFNVFQNASTSSNNLPLPTISNSFLTSTSFNESPQEISTSSNYASNSYLLTRNSEEFTVPCMTNLTVNVPKSVSLSQSTKNIRDSQIKNLPYNGSYTLNNILTETVKSVNDNIVSTTFNNPHYESINNHSILPNLSCEISDTNIMSTSFNSLFPDVSTSFGSTLHSSTPANKIEPTSLSLRNMKSSIVSNQSMTSNNTTVTNTQLLSTFYNSHCNLMSTSFNTTEINKIHENRQNYTENDDINMSEKDNFVKLAQLNDADLHTDLQIPPPPSLTNSFATYLQNLPRKPFNPSKISSGLNEIDENICKFSSRAIPLSSRSLRPNSLSNISQSQQESKNISQSKSYKLSYDLDYTSFLKNNEDESIQSSTTPRKKGTSSNMLHHIQQNYNMSSKFLDSKYGRSISQNNMNFPTNKEIRSVSNVPPLPVINPISHSKISPTSVDTSAILNEKPKVKFSDTVTHILVPGMGQSIRQKRPTTQMHITDPKRELAESLPLCLGNEDYLKNFQPLSKEIEEEQTKELTKSEESTKIKVVHFGLL